MHYTYVHFLRRRVINHPGLPGTCPVLALEAPCAGKTPSRSRVGQSATSWLNISSMSPFSHYSVCWCGPSLSSVTNAMMCSG